MFMIIPEINRDICNKQISSMEIMKQHMKIIPCLEGQTNQPSSLKAFLHEGPI